MENNKIKVTGTKVICEGDVERPYFLIQYRKLGETEYKTGCGSFDIMDIVKWLHEDFELVEEDDKVEDLLKTMVKMDEVHNIPIEILVMEECSELTQVLTKGLRYSKGDPTVGNRYGGFPKIFEEAVDVLVTTGALLYHMGYTERDIEEQMIFKLKRGINAYYGVKSDG